LKKEEVKSFEQEECFEIEVNMIRLWDCEDASGGRRKNNVRHSKTKSPRNKKYWPL